MPVFGRVGEDLALLGLLEEASDAPVFVVDDHYTELRGVLDLLEDEGDLGPPLLVEGDGLPEVGVRQDVSADDDEPLSEPILRKLHRAGGPQRVILDGVFHFDAPAGAAAEIVSDVLGHELKGGQHVLEAVMLEELDDVFHARRVGYRDHRFGLVAGQRPEPRPLAPGHDHGLHAKSSRSKRLRARPRPRRFSALPFVSPPQ